MNTSINRMDFRDGICCFGHVGHLCSQSEQHSKDRQTKAQLLHYHHHQPTTLRSTTFLLQLGDALTEILPTFDHTDETRH